MKQRAATIFCLAALLLFIVYAGYVFAALALGDPDTAFIVAIGQWILDSGRLPAADTFSWTIAPDTPYICYQWLSAVVYAGAYNIAGPAGVIACGGSLVFVALVAAPLLACMYLRLPAWMVTAIIYLLFSACSFRLPARPELFSYAFISCGLSAYLCYTAWLSRTKQTPLFTIRSWTIAWLGIFSAFVFWANLHTGFVIGFSLLALLFLSTLCITSLDAVIKRNVLAIFTGISFVMIHLAVLINANGLGLFLYLPRLFFMRSNRLNVEQMPIALGQLLDDQFGAFTILVLAMVGCLIAAGLAVWRARKEKVDAPETTVFWPALLGLYLHACLMIAAAIFCRRLVPFAALEAVFCMIGSLWVIHGGRPILQDKEGDERKAARSAGILTCLAGVAFMVGIALECGTSRLALPNTSMTLGDLEPALNFIQKERPMHDAMQGRLYNDAQFGDLVMLRFKGAIPVAMDTRFDLYGDDLVMHYWQIANARGRFREDLDKEKIQWLFFPPQAPIVSKLVLDPDFEVVFRDAGAVILLRKH